VALLAGVYEAVELALRSPRADRAVPAAMFRQLPMRTLVRRSVGPLRRPLNVGQVIAPLSGREGEGRRPCCGTRPRSFGAPESSESRQRRGWPGASACPDLRRHGELPQPGLWGICPLTRLALAAGQDHA